LHGFNADSDREGEAPAEPHGEDHAFLGLRLGGSLALPDDYLKQSPAEDAHRLTFWGDGFQKKIDLLKNRSFH